jgi:cytochrome b561
MNGALRLDITVATHIGSARFRCKDSAKIMANPSASSGYSGMAKLLHWTIFVLLIVQFTVAWAMPHIGRNTKPDTLINLHLSFGVLLLALAIVRFGWRLIRGEPEPAAGLAPWELLASRTVYWLFYLLLLVLPVLGWVNASWRGFPVTFFGLIELPKLMATRAPGWNWTGDVHGLLSNYLMLTLVGVHVAAALYHWLVRRDAVMQRMWPGA